MANDDTYLDGFNDCLLLVRFAHELKSWDKAYAQFDFQFIKKIQPVFSNLMKLEDLINFEENDE